MRKETPAIGSAEFLVLALSALRVIIAFIPTKKDQEMRHCLLGGAGQLTSTDLRVVNGNNIDAHCA